MTDASEPSSVIRIGDAYALRTFRAEDGRLASVAQAGSHWQDGVCIATCLSNPDHVAPVRNCTCGVYAFWSVEELLDQYLESARQMVAVIRMDGDVEPGDKGLRASAAQIVAWWCAEDATELVEASVASIPATRPDDDRNVVVRRYHDRDVMIGMFPPPQQQRNNTEENANG
ncbi:hypothetical protein MINTM020_44730 [Mycobacterium paraintracellulare]|uniref:hypothetical protein n=1 Tax=Mycobacterium paraintracellulare TaxID=1138383 RepID=UPI001925B5BF|nr:hypothetical protein [Mycobacterium paraintracellulare]BCP12375.1 hypothetical protein MINTM020_44730 [Mycobacterium paraintracellulare]